MRSGSRNLPESRKHSLAKDAVVDVETSPTTQITTRNSKLMASDKPLSKSEILNALAESTQMSRKDVDGVLQALEVLIEDNLTKGSGIFNLPGLMKIYVHEKKATPEREGRNPATGEPITIKAKPASKVVKVRPLKKLKEMI